MSLDEKSKERIRKGIAAYRQEQKMLIQLISKYGGLSQSKFDEIFQNRELKSPIRKSLGHVSGESFILGLSETGVGGAREFHLDLLQHMIAIDLIDTKRNEKGEIIYILRKKR